jgi:hypothetical protein
MEVSNNYGHTPPKVSLRLQSGSTEVLLLLNHIRSFADASQHPSGSISMEFLANMRLLAYIAHMVLAIVGLLTPVEAFPQPTSSATLKVSHSTTTTSLSPTASCLLACKNPIVELCVLRA